MVGKIVIVENLEILNSSLIKIQEEVQLVSSSKTQTIIIQTNN